MSSSRARGIYRYTRSTSFSFFDFDLSIAFFIYLCAIPYYPLFLGDKPSYRSPRDTHLTTGPTFQGNKLYPARSTCSTYFKKIASIVSARLTRHIHLFTRPGAELPSDRLLLLSLPPLSRAFDLLEIKLLPATLRFPNHLAFSLVETLG